MLKFEIVSSRTVEGTDNKKYVAYMMQVRQDVTAIDANPCNVERRYSHFLDLYNGLKKEFPEILSSVNFPKKVVIGNFDPELISNRCTGFESLLKLIANNSRLRESRPVLAFLKDVELKQAKRLISIKEDDYALSVLETSFKLLNKVYTDRSRVVLLTLCRLVTFGVCGPNASNLAAPVERWATMALRRYEGVSDSDLLQLYVPLLHACIKIWEVLGRDRTKLVEELNDLRKRGMKVDNTSNLIDAIEALESSYN